MAEVGTLYATVRSDEAIVKLAQLADLTDLKRWPLGLPVAVAERVNEIHRLAESILGEMELEEDKPALEPAKVSVKVGELEIVSDGPAVFGSTIRLNGKDVPGVRGVILAGSVDEVWSLSLDMVPGVKCKSASSENG